MLEEQQTGKKAQDTLVRAAAGLAETGVVYRAGWDQSIFKYVMHLLSEQWFSYRLNFAYWDTGPAKAVYIHWESEDTKRFSQQRSLYFCCVATWVVGPDSE